MQFIASTLLTFGIAAFLRWLEFPLWFAVLGAIVGGIAVPYLLALIILRRRSGP